MYSYTFIPINIISQTIIIYQISTFSISEYMNSKLEMDLFLL